MDPTNRATEIKIENTRLRLVFDLNTFVAFEEVTGKMFLGWLEGIQDAARKANAEQKRIKQLKARMEEVPTPTDEDSAEQEPTDPLNETAKLELDEAMNAAGSVMLRSVSMKDFRALVWAANHVYNRSDDPVWPLQLGQIGKLITLANFGQLLPVVLRGSLDALPANKKKAVTEEDEVAAGAETPFQRSLRPKNGSNGGNEFGASDAEALDLLERN